MSNFDVKFLDPKLKSSSGDYSFLVDQLTMKENQLSADGKLSPSDYDILNGMARKMYSYPGLSANNRASIEVKMSNWSKQKSTTQLSDNNDLSRLNDETADELNKATMMVGNDPAKFVKVNVDVTRAKLNALSDSINSLELSGSDASAHRLEFKKTADKLNDLLDAQDAVTNAKPGQKPGSGFAAYITTNARGEITDVKIDRAGAVGGYSETNATYGGLTVYGKPRIQDQKQVFKIGNSTFSTANVMVPDPANPGAFKTNILTSDDQKTALGTGGFSKATAGQVKELNPAELKTQTAIPDGQYAKGSNGFYYQAKPDGTYKKIVGATPEKLGVQPGDIMNVPKGMESSLIIPRVNETADLTMPVTPPPAPPTGQVPSAGPSLSSSAPLPPPDILPGKGSPPPQPAVRAPNTASGIADQIQKGGFLQTLFGAFRGNSQ